jgi:uroporphyrinogen decarboxylase
MISDFAGKTVVTLESRRTDDMVRLIEQHGGVAIAAPSMREAKIDNNDAATRFADTLLAGEVHITILLTGVGTRMLIDAVSDRDAFLAALAKTTIVTRGPKPVAVLREVGIKPDVVVPEPNTWRDLLVALDKHGSLDAKRIAVQEYGMSNTMLLDGLRERGARVTAVPVYRWELPEDVKPLRDAIAKMVAGDVDVLLVTSATQAEHLFKVADNANALRAALCNVLVGSVGPIASEGLEAQGVAADYEPDSPHMAPLVQQTARVSAWLLDKKRTAHRHGIDTNAWRRIDMHWPPPPDGYERTIADSVFMKACRREPTPYTPVWLMRQIGRYQREYHKWKKELGFVNLPADIAAELTLMSIDRLNVDAAIILADILPVIVPMGLHLEYVKGVGPVIDNPVRGKADLSRIAERADAGELQYVYDAVRMTRKSLQPDKALIGFCGSPFTIASYAIEGGKSSQYVHTKSLMRSDEATWHELMQRMVRVLIDYLNAQIDAGANAVQIFDSWAGTLGPDEYARYVQPHIKTLIEGVTPGTPVINFATGNPALLPLMKAAGGDVIGLDWRVDLAEAWQLLGDDVAVMGNLDPTVLYLSPAHIRTAAQAVLDKAAGRPGHIFNLGHGIMKDMDGQRVAELVDAVHELSGKTRGKPRG